MAVASIQPYYLIARLRLLAICVVTELPDTSVTMSHAFSALGEKHFPSPSAVYPLQGHMLGPRCNDLGK